MIALAGTAGGFAVDSVSFLVSASFLMLIVAPRGRPDGSRQNAWRDFVDGLAFIRRDRVLMTMIVLASVFFFGYAGSTYVGLPVLVKGPFRAGPRELGILFSASGLGALAGGFYAGTRGARWRGRVAMALIAFTGALLAAMALARGVWEAALLLAVSGAVMSWVGITFMTAVQQRADRAYLGRVMGMMMFGIYGLYPFSYGLAGWLSELGGVRLLFALGGAVIIAAAAVGLAVPEMRDLE
jgi:MFS family permease